MSGLGLVPRARCLSEALKKLKWAVLMSETLVATEGGAKAYGLGPPPRGHVGVQGPCCCGVHANLGGLCCHLKPWWYSGLGCCWGLDLCAWSYHTLGPSYCPWPVMPPKATQMPRVWVVSCDHVGVWGLCCQWGQVNFGGQCCHLGPWCHLDQGCCPGPCLDPQLYHSQGLCSRL